MESNGLSYYCRMNMNMDGNVVMPLYFRDASIRNFYVSFEKEDRQAFTYCLKMLSWKVSSDILLVKVWADTVIKRILISKWTE